MGDFQFTGAVTAAIGIGSGALVLLLVVIVWGFAKIVEYARVMAHSTENIHRQLRLMNDTLDEIQHDLNSKNV